MAAAGEADERCYYPLPAGLTVHKALFSLFEHYCKPVKSTIAPPAEQDGGGSLSMDGATFARLCRDAPNLGKIVSRTHVDLVFSKAKPVGVRRLDYEHFLDALLGLARTVYSEDEPTLALSTFMSRYLLALFDHKPCEAAEFKITLQQIFNDLSSA